MNGALLFVAGVAVGAIAAGFMLRPSDCCVRVAAGVRTRVGTDLGPTAQALGDLFGVWKYTPGLLTAFGVEP
jgi:hypothetical protein